MRLIKAALTAGLCAFVFTQAQATSRKADQIARKHVAAIGGDRFMELVAMRIEGNVSMQGVSAPFTLWRQRPDLSRVEMSIMGHDIIQAYDGEVAWWINPVVGANTPSIMPADFTREVAFWSDFDGPLVGYKKKRYKLRYMGVEEEPGGPAYKIRVAMTGGHEVYVYIDCETYLEVKRTHTQVFNGEPASVDTRFSNFAEIDGITIPQTISGVGFVGERFTMQLRSVVLDIEPDEGRFAMPGRERKKGSGLGY
jgi:hypothetical protein